MSKRDTAEMQMRKCVDALEHLVKEPSVLMALVGIVFIENRRNWSRPAARRCTDILSW
jgi:hypothetical protein